MNTLDAIFTTEELAAIRRVAERLGRPWHEGLGLAWILKADPGSGSRTFEARLGSQWRNFERSTTQDGIDFAALVVWEHQRRWGGGVGDLADRVGLPEGGTLELAARLGVSRRRAQQLLKRAVARFQEGDLFAGGVGS